MASTPTPTTSESKGSNSNSNSNSYTFGYSRATTSSHASRTIHSDAAFVIPHIKPHHKILDVGCGPGTITLGFADLVRASAGGSVTGVDAGLPVIESARQLQQLSRPSGDDDDDRVTVTFVQGNVLQGLPFADSTFDVVFTSQTLIHLAPVPAAPTAALAEIRRVLKPGGGLLAARDAACWTYYPHTAALQRCLTERMLGAMGTPEGAVGGRMKGLLRAAGWDVSEAAVRRGRFVAGAGTTVVTGADKCRWWRDSMGGRLRPGDAYRDGWRRAGFSDAECDEAKGWLDRWAEAEDAWYGVLQSEILIWK